MKTLLTLGETLACFMPEASGPLRYVTGYRMTLAGAESNLAINAAKLGIPSRWFSRLGRDEFGAFVCNRIRGEGVDCRSVVFDAEHPTGLMFKQIGAGETRVTYYRAGSAASFLAPEDITPDLFEGVGLLHLTGITPVLSESCRDAVLAAAQMARAQGIPLSFDPNIRRKLWHGTDHTPLLRQLALQSTVLLLGREEAEALFGTDGITVLGDTAFAQGVQIIALKDGARGCTVAVPGQPALSLPPWPCHCVEPVGAGDAFNAGFLAGWLQGLSPETCGRMGAIAGAMATETPGDIEGTPTREQMEAALSGQAEIYR